MKSQWTHFSEARSSVADFLHKMTAQYRDREDTEVEAESLLLRWLAEGKLQANAYQIAWNRGSGAFGEGKAGSRYSIDRDGNRLPGPVIAIPQQFWQQWQSANDAARSILEYRHYDHDKSVYVVATEDPARPLDASFAASDFKLAAAGQGEIYRVVVVDHGALVRLRKALDPKPKTKPGPIGLADWEAIKEIVFRELRAMPERPSRGLAKRVEGMIERALEEVGNATPISSDTIANRAKAMTRDFLNPQTE